MTDTPALSLMNLTKRFGSVPAVSDLSFDVPRGSICGFLGPNGAGKTTSIRMILGLTEPSSGRISVLGAPDARRVRRRIGFLPEERGLYKKMTPVDAIAFFASLKGIPSGEGRRRARALLEAQGLGHAANRRMKALSKGMAQKVQLLSAIAHEPEFVILDEPFSGLDPVNQQGLEATIREIAARGATVLFSTHVMQHAERLCDKVVLLAHGRKAFEGTVTEARATAPRHLDLVGALAEADVAALPGVASVSSILSPAGEPHAHFRAALAPGATGQEALRQAFSGGLDIQRFSLLEPSLHDAFIGLTGISPDADTAARPESAA